MIIIKCTHCGKEMERTKEIDNAVCFDCKKEKAKERRKTGAVGIPKPDNYEISDEEIQKRLTKIRKDNLTIKQKKYGIRKTRKWNKLANQRSQRTIL